MIPYLVRPERIEAFAEQVVSWDAVVFDCETTGLKPRLGDHLLGIGMGPLSQGEKPTYYYVPVAHEHPDDDPAWNAPEEAMRPLWLAMQGKPLVGYNIKFDLHVMAVEYADLGLFDFPDERLFDVLPWARIMSSEDRPFLELDRVAGRELLYEYRSPAAGNESEFGRRKWSVRDIGLKCCEDVLCTGELYWHFKKKSTPRLTRLYRREVNLTRTLYDMERRGLAFDAEEVGVVGKKLAKSQTRIRGDLQGSTGIADFNPRSAPQVEALMASLGVKPRALNKPKKDGSQSAKWQREQLLEVDRPEALGIAQYRALGTLDSNYIKLLKEYVKRGLEVMHFAYQNWGTVSGRLSAKDPNVQAMSKGWLQLGELGETGEALRWDEDGPDKTLALRTVYVPRRGYVFLEADYRQIEMFVAGYYMRDPAFLKLLQSEDFHAATALWVWGSAAPEFRRRAKVFNFGLLYGMGEETLAKKLGCTLKEAAKYRQEYFAKIGPGYRRALLNLRAWLNRRGYVENVFGRRYYVDPEQEYLAFNYVVQGSSGDFVKFRQQAIKALCQELDIHPILTTHDDILFEVPRELLKSYHLKRLVDILEDGEEPFGMRLPVKLKVSETNLAEMEEFVVPKAA